MSISTLFFDLDGTLYPNNNGLWEAIAQRMNIYLAERLNFPPDQIPAIRESYFQQYGTTLKGLQVNHQVDSYEYLDFVHDLPLSEYIAPDPVLKTLLARQPYPKWIFTNSDLGHATRVLTALDVEDQFEGIMDVTRLEFLNKPDPKAFERALEISGSPDPETCIFFEDVPKNLAPAKTIGLKTVLVGDKASIPEVDQIIPSIHQMQAAIDFFNKPGGTA